VVPHIIIDFPVCLDWLHPIRTSNTAVNKSVHTAQSPVCKKGSYHPGVLST